MIAPPVRKEFAVSADPARLPKQRHSLDKVNKEQSMGYLRSFHCCGWENEQLAHYLLSGFRTV
jgi:hypothetical protein